MRVREAIERARAMQRRARLLAACADESPIAPAEQADAVVRLLASAIGPAVLPARPPAPSLEELLEQVLEEAAA